MHPDLVRASCREMSEMPGAPPWNMRLGAEESLGLWSLLAGALLIVVNIILSIQLSLGLHRTFIVATVRCKAHAASEGGSIIYGRTEASVDHDRLLVSCRCIVQLTILAYVLAPAFALNRWWLLLVYFAVMVVISSIETVSRPPASYEVCGHPNEWLRGCAKLSDKALHLRQGPTVLARSCRACSCTCCWR